MKIDLHNHTTHSSACSILENRDLIIQAKALGLDGICVTEHNTMAGGLAAQKLGQELDFLVIPGQEVRTLQGDILCFGIHEEGLCDIDTSDLIHLAQECGGLLIPAHPYRISALALRDQVFDYQGAFCALEGLNGNCNEQENQRSMDAAHALGLPLTGGSDAHSLAMAGRYYTEFAEEIRNEEDLLRALRSGDFHSGVNPLYRKSHEIHYNK